MTKTALITGAARRVGAEIARRLAADGWNIAIHCHRSDADAQALAGEIREMGQSSIVVSADLEAPDAAQVIFAGLGDFPPITALIHNASRFQRDRFGEIEAEELNAHLAMHVTSPLLLTQAFAAQLPQGAAGNVIFLLDGLKGWSMGPNFLSYTLSKRAMEGMIEPLATTLAPRVRVNGLALGPTLPGEMDHDHTFDKLAGITPLKRVSNPGEAVHALRFLLAAQGVTGQVVDLAGGMHLPVEHGG